MKNVPKRQYKRIKKTHGPDFESYDHIQGDDKCDYCLLTAQCNRNGEPERLLICKDCNAKAHPSCMNYSESLARRARDSPWQCIDCKTCYMCNDSGDAVSDEMLFCDACDKGYHMSCHDPAITEKPTGKWMCSSCVLEDGDDSSMDQSNSPTSEMNDSCNTDGGPSYLPTPVHSPVLHPVMNGHASPSEMLRPIALPAVNMVKKETIPDASTWIIDDVVDYFKTKGFEEQAEVFREQEIDGKSLLLLKRNDVLTGLSLKLGPALKMYKHVEKLQSRDTIV